jgi:hypothetical protein
LDIRAPYPSLSGTPRAACPDNPRGASRLRLAGAVGAGEVLKALVALAAGLTRQPACKTGAVVAADDIGACTGPARAARLAGQATGLTRSCSRADRCSVTARLVGAARLSRQTAGLTDSAYTRVPAVVVAGT